MDPYLTFCKSCHKGDPIGTPFLIFSAIGGIWVPAYVMPSIMRTISEISPLKWAMDGFYGLFLRGEGFVDIIPHFFKLAVFFAVCLLIAIRVQSRKRIG